MLGLQQGWNDTRGRGTLIVATLNFVRLRSPPVAIFENVAAFCRSEEGQTMKWLVDTVVSLGYHVDHRILCTSDYGLPQTRKRWYLVALRSDMVSSSFAWPSAVAS
jgi:DNA (cytosine-5)-methyltransferase 1